MGGEQAASRAVDGEARRHRSRRQGLVAGRRRSLQGADPRPIRIARQSRITRARVCGTTASSIRPIRAACWAWASPAALNAPIEKARFGDFPDVRLRASLPAHECDRAYRLNGRFKLSGAEDRSSSVKSGVTGASLRVPPSTQELRHGPLERSAPAKPATGSPPPMAPETARTNPPHRNAPLHRVRTFRAVHRSRRRRRCQPRPAPRRAS